MTSEALLWVLWCCLCYSRGTLRTQQLSFLPEVQAFPPAASVIFPSSLSIYTPYGHQACACTQITEMEEEKRGSLCRVPYRDLSGFSPGN